MSRSTTETALVPQMLESRPRMTLNRNSRFIEDAVIVTEEEKGVRAQAAIHGISPYIVSGG